MANSKVKTKLKVNKQKPAKATKGKKSPAKKSAKVAAKVTSIKPSKIVDFSKAIIQQVNKSKREAEQQLSKVIKLLNVAEKNNDKFSKKIVQLQTKLQKAEHKLDNKKTSENKNLVKATKQELKVLTNKAKIAEQNLNETRKTFDLLTINSEKIAKLVDVIAELKLSEKPKAAKTNTKAGAKKQVVVVPHEDHPNLELEDNHGDNDDFDDYLADEDDHEDDEHNPFKDQH
jgi:hypothetical protein